jgi:hypothetical protein
VEVLVENQQGLSHRLHDRFRKGLLQDRLAALAIRDVIR